MIKILKNYAHKRVDVPYMEVAEPYFIKVVYEFESLIDAEVEKRIKERMPTENDKRIGADRLFGELTTNFKEGMYSGFFFGCDFIRSRLTTQVTPQDTHQVQKEGGGE